MIQHCHRLKAHRTIIDGLIAGYRGRIFNTAGDSIIADFPSAVDAVQCAVAVQKAIGKEDANRPAGEPMLFRIGIHVGDVISRPGVVVSRSRTIRL
jgi:adenylate cyclase